MVALPSSNSIPILETSLDTMVESSMKLLENVNKNSSAKLVSVKSSMTNRLPVLATGSKLETRKC